MNTSTDNLSLKQRSHAMRQVKGKNTAPELKVQQLLQELSYNDYQLHSEDVVGKPDIAWIPYKVALFIHGCFWHGHDCSRGARMPKSHHDYWKTKIERNVQRDQSHKKILTELGWETLIIWECELRNCEAIVEKLKFFLETRLTIKKAV